MINKVGRFFLAKGVKFVWLFQYPLCFGIKDTMPKIKMKQVKHGNTT